MLEHEKLVTDLISIRSVSGEEEKIRSSIGDWFKERGIDSFVQGENLIIHFEGKDKTRAFIFNSHMDTVSDGPEWKKDPWKATKEADRLIGLGVSDMKSGLTASMLLADQISQSGKPPVDTWFTYVVMEEVDGSGTENFAQWFEQTGQLAQYTDIAAIFTEPNSLQEVEHGHRGNYFLEVTARGASGHAGRPDELKGQKLAVRKMFNFANRFQRAATNWQKEFQDEYFDPSITVGEMTSILANARGKRTFDTEGKEILIATHGSVNKFPETCVATFDLRTTPSTHNLLYDRVLELSEKADVTVSQLYPPAPAGFTDPQEKIVQIASVVGGDRKLTVSQASADLGFLTAKGIKSIILGPGEKEQCHKPNEYAYPTQIPQAVEIYRQIVEAWAK